MSEEYVKLILTQNDCTECAVDDVRFSRPNEYQLKRGLYYGEHGIEILASRLKKWEEIQADYDALQADLAEVIADGRMAERARWEAAQRAKRKREEVREAALVRPWRR